MSLPYGAAATTPNLNGAYASKTADNTLAGKQTLSHAGSGANVEVQLDVNTLKGKFDTSTGHKHDGSDSKAIDAGDLLNKSTNMVQSIFAYSTQFKGDITLTAGPGVTVSDAGGVIKYAADGFPRTYYSNTSGITLPNNTASPTFLFARLATFAITELNIRIKRGTTHGWAKLVLYSDGTNGGTGVTIDLNEPFGSCGITFTADVQNLAGSDAVVLSYTTTNTGTAAIVLIEAMAIPTPA